MKKPKTKTLRKNTTVYHGTSVNFDEKSEELYSPCWISTSHSVAQNFTSWHGGTCPRVLEYRLNKSLKLALIETAEDFAWFDPENDFTDNEERCEAVLEHFDGWIIPNNYPDGDDIMIGDSSVLEYIATHYPQK